MLSLLNIPPAIQVIMGLMPLLFGYRLFKLCVFMFGFALVASIASLFMGSVEAMLVGLVAGAICVALWYLGVFVIGALAGGVFGAMCAVAIGLGGSSAYAFVVVVFAIIGGVLALAVRKFMIILSTSWFGASVVVECIAPAVGLTEISTRLLTSLGLTVVSMAFQYGLTAREKKASESCAAPSTPQSGEKRTDGIVPAATQV